MTKTQKTKSNQKPIDCDVHFKYRCPNSNCSADHWKTLKEVSVKNFKIVCYCGLVIKPKRIKKISIKYYKEPVSLSHKEQEQKTEKNTIPSDILEKCANVLIGYGFTKNESEELLVSAWLKNPTDNCAILIKNTLENIGVNYGKPDSSV